jgi:hypothetical protein
MWKASLSFRRSIPNPAEHGNVYGCIRDRCVHLARSFLAYVPTHRWFEVDQMRSQNPEFE